MTTVVNVCFHGVGVPQRVLDPGEDPYWITTDAFRRILDEVSGWPDVRLSFDDGNASDAEVGLPELRSRDLTATFFPVAGRIGTPGSMDAPGVRALVENGMELGSHGMWHRSWRRLPAQERRVEMVEARDQLAELAGRPVSQAALPLGRYDRQVLGELRRLGYSRVYSSDRRLCPESAWLQPRFSVTCGDDPRSFRDRVLASSRLLRRARTGATGFIKRCR